MERLLSYDQLKKHFREWSRIYCEMSPYERSSLGGVKILTLIRELSDSIKSIDKSIGRFTGGIIKRYKP